MAFESRQNIYSKCVVGFCSFPKKEAAKIIVDYAENKNWPKEGLVFIENDHEKVENPITHSVLCAVIDMSDKNGKWVDFLDSSHISQWVPLCNRACGDFLNNQAAEIMDSINIDKIHMKDITKSVERIVVEKDVESALIFLSQKLDKDIFDKNFFFKYDVEKMVRNIILKDYKPVGIRELKNTKELAFPITSILKNPHIQLTVYDQANIVELFIYEEKHLRKIYKKYNLHCDCD